MITLIEQNTLDICWFFTNGENIAVVMSAGGKLPNSIARKSLKDVEQLADYFKNLDISSDINTNPNLKNLVGRVTDQYLSSFLEMTERGIFSFDRKVPNNFSDTNYFLVARPLNPLKFSELPSEIAEIIINTTFPGTIQENLDISSFL